MRQLVCLRRLPVLLREQHCYHQQYLSDAKNPNGYCGIGGTGVVCPVGVGLATDSEPS